MYPSTLWVQKHPARQNRPPRYYVLRMAFARGLDGSTFATYGDARTPGYDRAYLAGVRARNRFINQF